MKEEELAEQRLTEEEEQDLLARRGSVLPITRRGVEQLKAKQRFYPRCPRW